MYSILILYEYVEQGYSQQDVSIILETGCPTVTIDVLYLDPVPPLPNERN